MGIGQRIKEISKDKGFTLRQLAKEADVSYNTLYSITKRDSERIQGSILQRISTALEVSPSALIGAGGEPFDDVFGIIVKEYPKATFSPGYENSVRLSLGSSSKSKLLKYFGLLNEAGQQEAVKRVEELTEIPRYQRQDATETPPAPQESTDTTSPQSPSEGS